jgi:hypothetical protein
MNRPPWSRFHPGPALCLVLLFAVAIYGVVRPAPPPTAPTVMVAEKSAESGKEDSDRRIAEYTAALAWWTGGLAVASFIELLYLARAERTARAGAEIAKQQASISEKLAEITEKQHDLANRAYFNDHRPRLIVRDAVLPSEPELTGPLLVRYDLVNTGDSGATIRESRIFVGVHSSGRPVTSPRTDGHDDLRQLRLEAGEFRELTCPIDLATADAMRQNDKGSASRAIFLTGVMIYADDAGKQRRTVFRRRFQREGWVFAKTENPDYEYSD